MIVFNSDKGKLHRNGAATVRERLHPALTALSFAVAQRTPERSRDRQGAVVSIAWPLFDIRGSDL